MPVERSKHVVRRLRLTLWIAFAATFLYLYYAHAGGWRDEFRGLAASSALLGYGMYLLLGSVRGFTLIPCTNLVLLAIPLFPPVPLFALTLLGIAFSSASIYAFAESLHVAQYFEARHPEKIARVRAALARNPTTIVAAWSFLPVAPTDLICYACGAMEIPFGRFMLGVMLGEGAICAAYIFAGQALLDVGRRLLGL
jgi:uncharacterized membrane protein YdjX (TVP38/TMEM64 family)